MQTDTLPTPTHDSDRNPEPKRSSCQPDLSRIGPATSPGGETRAERVERLRREVESGEYTPDFEAVARSMIDAGVV